MYVRYSEELLDQGLGHGLLHPSTSERLHVGVCGYFDEEGDWKTIVDIPMLATDKNANPSDLKFTTLSGVPVLPEPTIVQWEPKCSLDVSSHKIGATTDLGYSFL